MPDPASLSFGNRDIDDGPTAIQTSTVDERRHRADRLHRRRGRRDRRRPLRAARRPDERLPGHDDPAALAELRRCACASTRRPVNAKSASITIDSTADDVSVPLSGTGTQTLLSRDPATLALRHRTTSTTPRPPRRSRRSPTPARDPVRSTASTRPATPASSCASPTTRATARTATCSTRARPARCACSSTRRRSARRRRRSPSAHSRRHHHRRCPAPGRRRS